MNHDASLLSRGQHTLIPEMAMEPKRKVVMPPMTQVGVLAKKAPICKPNEGCLCKLAVDTSGTTEF